MAAYCYILQCADGSLYTGWTSDVESRVRAHNAGRGGRYTRAHRPVRLIYTEPQPDATTARKREVAIKRLPRAKKLALAGRKRAYRLRRPRTPKSPAG